MMAATPPPPPPPPPPPGTVVRFIQLPDGELLVYTTSGLFRGGTGQGGWTVVAEGPAVLAMTSHDGFIAWSDAEGSVWTLRLGGGRRLIKERLPALTTALALSPDGWLAMGRSDGGIEIKLQDGSSGTTIPTVHHAHVTTLLWLPDHVLLSGGADGRLVLWDHADPPRHGRSVLPLGSPVLSLMLGAEGVEAACADGTVHTILPLGALPLPRLRLRPTDDPLAAPVARQLAAWKLLGDDGIDTAIGPGPEGAPLHAELVIRVRPGPVEARAVVPPLDEPPLGDDVERRSRLGVALERAMLGLR
jgi:hypothetical protein